MYYQTDAVFDVIVFCFGFAWCMWQTYRWEEERRARQRREAYRRWRDKVRAERDTARRF